MFFSSSLSLVDPNLLEEITRVRAKLSAVKLALISFSMPGGGGAEGAAEAATGPLLGPQQGTAAGEGAPTAGGEAVATAGAECGGAQR